MAESGRIRSRKTNFAAVSNEILHRKDVSLKAKGLYALIQSFICNPDFVVYKKVLMQSYSCEGRTSFDAAWNELYKLGYLVKYQVPAEHGHFAYEYELLDSVQITDQANAKKSNAIDTQLKKLQKNLPMSGFPTSVKPTSDEPTSDNPTSNNTDNSKTDNNKTYNTNKLDDDETMQKFTELVKMREGDSTGFIEEGTNVFDYISDNFVVPEIPESFINEQMPMRSFMSSDDKFYSYVSKMWQQKQMSNFIDGLCVASTKFNSALFNMKTQDIISEENEQEKVYILAAIDAYKNNPIAIFKINNATFRQRKIVIDKVYSRLLSITEVQNPKGYCYRIIEKEIVFA